MRNGVSWGALLLFAGLAQADTTWVSGNVSGVWEAGGNPYIVTGSLSVPTGAMLEITQGVRVEFHSNWPFTVNGTLHCLGTATDPVIITQDTIAFPQRWQGIVATTSSSDTYLRHTIIEHTLSYIAGVTVNGSTVFLEEVQIRHCGLGISAEGGTVSINGGDIFRCGGPGGAGGGLRAYGGTEVEARNLGMSHCRALDGGGMFFNDSFGEFWDCTFQDLDGGIWGGAVYAEDSPMNFTRCNFEDDSCAVGAGAYIVGVAGVTFDHCLFIRNRSHTGNSEGYHAAVYAPGAGDHSFTNCLFYGNLSTSSAIIRLGGHNVIEQCAFISNSSPLFQANSAEVYYSDFQPRATFGASFLPGTGVLDRVNGNGDSTDAYGNLFVAPGFVNEAWGDFHLEETSHLIDAGNPVGPVDPDSTTADIGPYHFNQVPQVTDLTIYRSGNTSDILLRWSRPRESLSYKVFRCDVFPWENERQVFLGATSDSMWYDSGVVPQSASAYYQVITFLQED